MKKVTIAFAGLGNRGKDAYLPAFMSLDMPIEIAAIADIDPAKVAEVARRYNVPADRCYTSAEEMLEQPRLADAMCIATMDRQHVPQAIPALKKGYHLLLEKPISPELSECREISQVAAEENRQVIICHVLRYTPFYRALKEQLDSGVIGDIVTTTAIENVGYWHQAHSFVRGNWANSEETSPMILQKCCHDMDILLWLTGKTCKTISSFGGLHYFRPEMAPKGAAKRCMDGCKVKESCPFDAENFYMDNPRMGINHGKTGWPADVLALKPTPESVLKAIKEGPYGRCVFACGNNVVDHQVVNALMTDDSTISFTMSGFTDNNTRYIKLMGTQGEIYGEMEKNLITIQPFGKAPTVIDVAKLNLIDSGHGGGDKGLAQEFAKLIAGEPVQGGLTSLDVSVESHYMSIAAELSRLENGKAISIDEMRQGL